MWDLSAYIKLLKQRFTQWFNRWHRRCQRRNESGLKLVV